MDEHGQAGQDRECAYQPVTQWPPVEDRTGADPDQREDQRWDEQQRPVHQVRVERVPRPAMPRQRGGDLRVSTHRKSMRLRRQCVTPGALASGGDTRLWAKESAAIWSDIWHQEAHHSTAPEGNTLILREVEQLLEQGRAVGAKPLRECSEVKGYADAARWVYGQALDCGVG